MNELDKQDSKVSAIFSLGAFVEDQLEKYRKELLGLEGTKQALVVLANKLEGYIQTIDEELTNKKITFNESSVAKRHVATCIRIIKDLCEASIKQQTIAEGKIAASDFYVQKFKEMYDEEKAAKNKLKEKEDAEATAELAKQPVMQVSTDVVENNSTSVETTVVPESVNEKGTKKLLKNGLKDLSVKKPRKPYKKSVKK